MPKAAVAGMSGEGIGTRWVTAHSPRPGEHMVRVGSSLIDDVERVIKEWVPASETMRRHIVRQVDIAIAAGARRSDTEWMYDQYEAQSSDLLDVIWVATRDEMRNRMTAPVVMSVTPRSRRGRQS